MKIQAQLRKSSIPLSLLLLFLSSCIFQAKQQVWQTPTQEAASPTHVASPFSLDTPDTPTEKTSTPLPVLTATVPGMQVTSEKSSTPTPASDDAEAIDCSDLAPLDLSLLTLGFSAEWSGNRELYTIRADGSNLVRMTTTERDFSTFVWSPDAKTILAWEANSHKVFLVEVASGQVRDILADLAPDLDIVPPFSWSPDGLKIAFTASDKRTQALADLYVLELATMGLARISFPEGYEYHADNPLWSADGQYILYTANGWGINSTAVGRGRFGLVALLRLSDQALEVFGLEPGFNWEMAKLWVEPNRFITLANELGQIPSLYQITLDASMEPVARKPLPLSENTQISRDGQIALTPNSAENGQWFFNITHMLTGQSIPLNLPITELVDFSWGYDNRVFAVLTHDPGEKFYNLSVIDICTEQLIPVAQGINSFTWKP